MANELDVCSYCAELKKQKSGSYFLREVADKIGLRSRYLFTTKTFLVFPSVGALTAGHLLIIPRDHITAMAYLNNDQLFELAGVIEEVGALLYKIYKTPPIAMEHGVINELTSTGACVDHAHIHIMPLKFDLVGSVNKRKKKINLSELLDEKDRDGDYLIYTNDLKEYYVSDLGVLPSQYLRKLIFDRCGLYGSWNWKEDNRAEIILKTVNDISSQYVKFIDNKLSNKWLQPTLLTSRG